MFALPEGRFTEGLPAEARAAVAMVRDAARGLLSDLKPDKPAGGGTAEADTGLKIATSAVQSLFEVAESMAADPEAQRYTVLWCSRGDGRGGDGATRLHAAPLAVNGLIRTHLLTGRATVLTSATLSLGGEFRSMARGIGLEGASDKAAATASAADGPGGTDPAPGTDGPSTLHWRGIDVGSPFDYPKQGILYIARRRPHAGAVLLAARGDRGGRGDAGAAGRAGAGAGRRPAADPGAAVRRGRAHLPVRHAVALAGRGRARPRQPAGADRPDPVPAPR
jgi:ATP-dependent DNA helicase DinG